MMMIKKMQMKQTLNISHLTKPEKLNESIKTFRSQRKTNVTMLQANVLAIFKKNHEKKNIYKLLQIIIYHQQMYI